jgi:hypothetical protein
MMFPPADLIDMINTNIGVGLRFFMGMIELLVPA